MSFCSSSLCLNLLKGQQDLVLCPCFLLCLFKAFFFSLNIKKLFSYFKNSLNSCFFCCCFFASGEVFVQKKKYNNLYFVRRNNRKYDVEEGRAKNERKKLSPNWKGTFKNNPRNTWRWVWRIASARISRRGGGCRDGKTGRRSRAHQPASVKELLWPVDADKTKKNLPSSIPVQSTFLSDCRNNRCNGAVCVYGRCWSSSLRLSCRL